MTVKKVHPVLCFASPLLTPIPFPPYLNTARTKREKSRSGLPYLILRVYQWREHVALGDRQDTVAHYVQLMRSSYHTKSFGPESVMNSRSPLTHVM